MVDCLEPRASGFTRFCSLERLSHTLRFEGVKGRTSEGRLAVPGLEGVFKVYGLAQPSLNHRLQLQAPYTKPNASTVIKDLTSECRRLLHQNIRRVPGCIMPGHPKATRHASSMDVSFGVGLRQCLTCRGHLAAITSVILTATDAPIMMGFLSRRPSS